MVRSVETAVGEVSGDTAPEPVRSPRGRAGKRSNGTGAKRPPAMKRASGAVKGNKTGQKRKPRTVDVAKLDQFGLRLHSKKSKAAAMYASKRGATLEETKKATGSVQYNVLSELESKGHKIKRMVDSGDKDRKITRFWVTA